MQTETSTLRATASPRRSLEMVLAGVMALGILLVFWQQQRYPALLKKLHAGGAIHVGGAISFDTLLRVDADMDRSTRVVRTSVNWLYTNRYGMFFALPFGAALMTLLASTAVPKRFSSAAGNVLCGAIAGAPLGVCTNCATPVAQSLLAGGASSRMTVAAMISSPSFNPVVVAMAFVLLPLPLAGLRVVVPAVLLGVLPWLVPETRARGLGLSMPALEDALSTRVLRFLRAFFRNLLRLTLMTLPWMLLAAVAGALAAELIPVYGTHMPVSVLGVVGVAVLGTLLPVTMALDVALAYVLYHAGVSTVYVAVLLCTLGPVSVYSLSALGQQLGRRTSLRLAGATAGLGCLAGFWLMRFPGS